MTQENTGDRDEARRMNEDATRRASSTGTTTDATVSEETSTSSSSTEPTFDPNSTVGLGKPSWFRQMISFHTKTVDGFSGLQETPEKMLSAGTSAVWDGLFGLIGKAFKKGATSIGISEKTYDSWTDNKDRSMSAVADQASDDFMKAYGEGKKGFLSMGDGLIGILSLVGVNITNQVDTPTPTDTRVADAGDSTSGVNPSLPIGRDNGR